MWPLHTGWFGRSRIALALALAIMVAHPVAAQGQPADARQQWLAMDALSEKAFLAGNYSQAIALAQNGLEFARRTFGNRDAQTLASLVTVAFLYEAQHRYSEAEPYYREALQTRREVLGARHADTLDSINSLASLYESQGRYGEAEPLYLEALQARREVFGPRHPQTLTSANNLAFLYKAQGRYAEAEPIFLETLQTRREVLGQRDPATLASLNNLAGLYRDQGRYGEAEPLLWEVLEASREVLGPRHERTLATINNIGGLYTNQGRYDEAERHYREALLGRREVLGPRHPDTLDSINNLAALYFREGRYGEAEPLYREALLGRREVLGPRHPKTLASISNLAVLYLNQARHGEAEPLFREALQAEREILGPRHPSTLTSVNNLAALYDDQGRYGEAEPLYREALQVTREVLGPRHPDTLNSVNNLATLHHRQGRYGEAEPLYRETLQARREVLGPRHPDTLSSVNSLAVLYDKQGRYGEAEQLYREALQARREVLGPSHPDTLQTQFNMVILMMSQDQRGDAVRMLQQMEPDLLARIGQELYSTEAGAVRRELVSSQASFQDAVLTLATQNGSGDAGRLAANVMLRFKLLQGEEEAYLARLTRRSQDPGVRMLADELSKLRTALADAARRAPDAFAKTLRALETKQQALIVASPDYKNRLRVLTTNLDDIRALLPADAILIEFRQFQPVDARAGTQGESRFAGLLLAGFDEPIVADLGPVSELQQLATALDDQAAARLYQRLTAPFERRLAGAPIVYVAPDGILNLVPFARLKLSDGRYWGERQQVRLLQTGRDLLRPGPDTPARGLLALGGIDFGAPPIDPGPQDNSFFAAAGSDRAAAVSRTAASFRNGFARLPASADEANDVKEWYQLLRADEPAEIWSGANASKGRLMELKAAPRVLHLATHGFYRPNQSREPMLLSGIALAGANLELADAGTGGILFALEAEGLNLDGTELVVLSACDTAQGSLDYSEGVFGLARALRTAGARNVLVTLWKVNDGEARDFMVAFYKIWLTQSHSDPAKALRDTQLSWMGQDNRRDPRAWAAYVLIE
jgi:CHAT domain-containing protein/tetratricopeptide (TPR) repeat protein